LNSDASSDLYRVTLNIPKDDPAISLDVPHSWKPEVIDKGIAGESPDQLATVDLR
jgi:hypothetical protein